jgi:hypothetical protein
MLLVFDAVEPDVAPLPLVAPDDAVPPVGGVELVVPPVEPDRVLPLPVVGAEVPVPVEPDRVVPLPVEPAVPAVPEPVVEPVVPAVPVPLVDPVVPAVVPVLPVVPVVPVVPDVPAPRVVLGAVLGVVIAPPLAPRVPPVVAPPPVTEFWLDTLPRLPAEAPASLLRVEPLDAVCATAPPATSDATRRVRSLLIKISPVLSCPEHNHCVRAWMKLGRRIGSRRSDVGKLPSGPGPSQP